MVETLRLRKSGLFCGPKQSVFRHGGIKLATHVSFKERMLSVRTQRCRFFAASPVGVVAIPKKEYLRSAPFPEDKWSRIEHSLRIFHLHPMFQNENNHKILGSTLRAHALVSGRCG